MVYFLKLSFECFAIHTLFKLVTRPSAKNSRVTNVIMVVRMRNVLAMVKPRSWYVCFSADIGRVTYHDSIPHCQQFFPGTYISHLRI